MMSIKSACLILSLGSVIFIQACRKRSNSVEVDPQQTERNDRTDDDRIPRIGDDVPDDSTSDVSVEVIVKKAEKPSLTEQISDAKNILLPIYSEMKDNKVDSALGLLSALEALEFLSKKQTTENNADFCTKLGAVGSQLQNSSAPIDKRDRWLKSIQSLQAKAEICE